MGAACRGREISAVRPWRGQRERFAEDELKSGGEAIADTHVERSSFSNGGRPAARSGSQVPNIMSSPRPLVSQDLGLQL